MMGKLFLVGTLLQLIALGSADGDQVPSPSPVYQPGAYKAQGDQPPLTTIRGEPPTGFFDNQQAANQDATSYHGPPYMPGFGYEQGYQAPNVYDSYLVPAGYGSDDTDLYDPSPATILWSLLPNSRSVMNFVGRSAAYLISSAGVIILGAIAMIAACSFTSVCSITLPAVGTFGTIREEMRSFMTPEKLASASEFVKNAIDKYQKIQRIQQLKSQSRRR